MLKRWLGILKATGADFMEDRALRLAAAMAYYAVFSIGPLLVLIVGVAGLVMGEETVRKEVTGQLRGMVGSNSAELLESMMKSQHRGGSLMATIIGGIALLFGASGVFGQLQDALNTIWEVRGKPGAGVWGFIRDRFLSMTMVLGTGFLLLISMVLTTVVAALSSSLSNLINVPAWVATLLNEGLALVMITLLFALIFKVLPDVKIRWHDVWPGAFGTALLFVIGKFLLGLYLGRQGTSSAYGLGSSFVVVLLWIYYSSLILFLGAEFTQVLAKARGHAIEPSENAQAVTEDARAQQGMPPKDTGTGKGELSREPAGAKSGTLLPQPTFAKARAVATESMNERVKTQVGVVYPPLDQIKAQPWTFVGMALAAGMAAGLLLKMATLRKALKIYAMARRFV